VQCVCSAFNAAVAKLLWPLSIMDLVFEDENKYLKLVFEESRTRTFLKLTDKYTGFTSSCFALTVDAAINSSRRRPHTQRDAINLCFDLTKFSVLLMVYLLPAIDDV